jgi:hypothetical protein
MGVDISGRKPKTEVGDYFSSNWWGWRPINAICEIAAYDSKLKIDFSYWGSNDGKGLKTQKQCDKLADAIELLISENSQYNENLADDDDRIYIVMGSWCEAGTGKFIPSDFTASLNEQYEYGDILYGPVVAENGTMVESSHSASFGRLKEWITFLRNCGGFKIW